MVLFINSITYFQSLHSHIVQAMAKYQVKKKKKSKIKSYGETTVASFYTQITSISLKMSVNRYRFRLNIN